MDDRRFDAFTRALSQRGSRRAALKALLGIGGVAAVGGVALGDEVRAARRSTPTPQPVTCPGVQIWDGSICTCPAGTAQCGPDCCPAGAQCCDGACCYGICYGEELCCPTGQLVCNGVCLSAGACCTDAECSGARCLNNICVPFTSTNTAVPPSSTPTNTPAPPTNTPTDTPTNTPVPPTRTPTDTPTNTFVPPSNTPTNTPTNTPVPPTTTPTDTPTNTAVPPTFTITFGLINGSCSPFVTMGGFAPSTTYQFNMDYRVIATGQTGVLFQSMVTTNASGNATFSHQVDGAEGTVQVRARMNGFSSDFVTIDC